MSSELQKDSVRAVRFFNQKAKWTRGSPKLIRKRKDRCKTWTEKEITAENSNGNDTMRLIDKMPMRFKNTIQHDSRPRRSSRDGNHGSNKPMRGVQTFNTLRQSTLLTTRRAFGEIQFFDDHSLIDGNY